MDAHEINKMEKKWQAKWESEKVYESEPDGETKTAVGGKTKKPGKKKYITAAFPYPNSPQHIGHARTYSTTDIYARYWMLNGYNVLFPMAFHVTGTPILAMAKRIADKDEEVLSIFERIYGIDRKTAATLTEPNALVTHFSKEIEAGMKEMGYAIDWRRKFYSFDKKFNKFIEWQFKKLK
ncbi:MAG: class I tRNA ligase family protein, partial [Candidatus Micrarchaeia archaeon]